MNIFKSMKKKGPSNAIVEDVESVVVGPERSSPSKSEGPKVLKSIKEHGGRNESDDEEIDDVTCCKRATFCHPVLREMRVNETISTCCGKSPSWATLFWLVTCVGLVAMSWVILFFLLGSTMLPGGSIFGLFFLVVSSYVLGWLLTQVPYLQLPPVFGMLLAGILIRNSGFYNITEELGLGTTAKIRTFCLTFIMVRAGLQITTTPLRENRLFILLLALIPCSLEMLAVSVCSRLVLDMNWDWAFLTGAIVAAMSPVVTVNCILALAEQGYGEDKGVASLLCAAASIDTVFIVWIFSVCYTFVFTDDTHREEWWSKIPGGLRDFLLGVIVGVGLGLFLAFFPHRNHKHVMWYRATSLFLASVMCSSAASKLAITGGGFLAIFLMSFIAITGWKILTINYNTIPLQRAASYVWHFMQPVLVGVIGADIDFSHWSLRRFGLYVTCIIIGLMTRATSAFLSMFNTELTLKEKLFIALSWLPKGTMQAAFAPMAYERARKDENPEKVELAVDVVRISVVAIVFLAPLGAIIMMSTGPVFLKKISIEEHQRERQLSYLRIISLQPVRTKKKTGK